MMIVIGVFIILAGMILIWFYIPYSPVKSAFQRDVDILMSEDPSPADVELFTEEEFTDLPVAIQNYIRHCGYIGSPKMFCMKMEYHNVNFMQEKNNPSLKIDYTQYNFVREPCRMAFIDSRMFGIPFEGYDYYQDGAGGMKGVIAKAITLFDQTGDDMDKSCLVTFLAESLFVPSVLLQDYIAFEEISDYEVKATITFGGQTASGIFTFNEQYEMVSFTTNDRAVQGTDGEAEYVPWSALCGEYRMTSNGIKYPTEFQAVWNYAEGDFTYFDGTISKVSYMPLGG